MPGLLIASLRYLLDLSGMANYLICLIHVYTCTMGNLLDLSGRPRFKALLHKAEFDAAYSRSHFRLSKLIILIKIN